MLKLLGLEKKIEGGQNAPLEWLKKQEGVVFAELLDTTSSSGDWSGLFVVEQETLYHAVGFQQERSGDGNGTYTLYTNESAEANFDHFDDFQEVKDTLCKKWYDWSPITCPLKNLSNIEDEYLTFRSKVHNTIADAIEESALGRVELPFDGDDYEYSLPNGTFPVAVEEGEYNTQPQIIDESGNKSFIEELPTEDLVHLADVLYYAIVKSKKTK